MDAERAKQIQAKFDEGAKVVSGCGCVLIMLALAVPFFMLLLAIVAG